MRADGSHGAIQSILSKESKYHDGSTTLRAMIIDVCKSLNGMPISENAKREALEKMAKTMEEALEVKFTIDDFMANLQNLPTGDEGDLVKFYDEKIDDAMKASKRGRGAGSIAQHPQHKRLQQMLRCEEDEDVMIDESQTEASLIDPMTQKLLEEPMRSKKCAHVYSKASVEHFYARTANCAYPGCDAKLSKKDFERDAETEIALRRLKKKATNTDTPTSLNEEEEEEHEFRDQEDPL